MAESADGTICYATAALLGGDCQRLKWPTGRLTYAPMKILSVTAERPPKRRKAQESEESCTVSFSNEWKPTGGVYSFCFNPQHHALSHFLQPAPSAAELAKESRAWQDASETYQAQVEQNVRDAMQRERQQLRARDLSEVLPFVRHLGPASRAAPPPGVPWTAGEAAAQMPFDPRSLRGPRDASYVSWALTYRCAGLVHPLQAALGHGGSQVWRAEDEASGAMQLQARTLHGLWQREGQRDELLMPLRILMTKGHKTPWAWQASVALSIYKSFWTMERQLLAVQASTSTPGLPGVCVHGLTDTEEMLGRRALLLRAAPALGKTLVGCILATAKRSLVLVPCGLGQQWAKEARSHALAVLCLEQLAELEQAPAALPHMTIMSMALLQKFKQKKSIAAPAEPRAFLDFLQRFEVIIVDEVQKANQGALGTFWPREQPGASLPPLLMLSGTADSKTLRHLGAHVQAPVRCLEALVWSVDTSAIPRASFPQVDLEICMTALDRYERLAYETFLEAFAREEVEDEEEAEALGITDRALHRRLNALVLPHAAARLRLKERNANGTEQALGTMRYALGVLRKARQTLEVAQQEVVEPLVRVLAHALVPEEHRVEIAEVLGRDALVADIFRRVAEKAQQVRSRHGATETKQRVAEQLDTWKTRTRCVRFLSQELEKITSAKPEEELMCPVCMDEPMQAPLIALSCWHSICTACKRETEQQRGRVRCPVCRHAAPQYHTREDVIAAKQ